MKYITLVFLLSISQVVLADKCAELLQKQDYYEAVNECRSMAKKGEKNAQFALAILYYQGKGVMSDMGEAQKWMRKSAQQNHNQAQYNLGIMLANGQGSGVDLVDAYAWLKIAAENGYSEAENSVRQLGEELSSGEKEEANKRIELIKKEFKR